MTHSTPKTMKLISFIALAGVLLWTVGLSGQELSPSDLELELWTREEWLKNWTTRRERSGLTTHFDATYVFQGIAEGGFTGPFFPTFSDEDDLGHTLSGDLRVELDTEKLGWWKGGTWMTRFHGRTGQSAVQRAGSVAAVNNEALFPNVEANFDGNAFAITEMTYRHAINEKVGIYGGLLNTSLGDKNEIAGEALSHQHFLNFAMLYSLVEDATVPHASLGGGIDFAPTEDISGSFSVFGSAETAGVNPFDRWHGTTFSTEWTFAHKLGERPGAQTFGFLYGINARRTDIAADPRLVIISIVLGLPIPTTESDTWAFYYNAHQFVRGDDSGGWGVFARWGISDGNPNFVKQNAALGVGGVGLFPSRKQDRWGLGTFFVDMSEEDLLKGLNVGDEFGGEVYYNIAVRPSLHITLDAQVIDSALPRVDTTWVFGVRTNYSF
ncbi:MAG: porin [Planctomycetota bacterium]|nr:MAG: porin [Planctomycetota bacterium]